MKEIQPNWLTMLRQQYTFGNESPILMQFTLPMITILIKFFSQRGENRAYRGMLLKKLIIMKESQEVFASRFSLQ